MPLLSLPHRLIVLAQVKAFFFWGNLSQAPWLEVAPFLSPAILYLHPEELKAGSQRYLYTHVHGSIIHNSQEVC